MPQPLLEDLRRAAAFVFVGLPVDAERQHIAPGEYVVRNLVGFDPRQGVVAVSGELQQGQKLVFTLRDGNRSRDDLQLALAAQAQTWAGQTPSFGLYFNCASRGRGLYGFPDLDTSYIKQYLGEVPIIGFFSGCEIGPVQRQSSLQLYSGVLVLIGEKTMH